MEWVETTGRTLEAALDLALDQLGVDEDDVEFEVLAEPKAGLFGRFGGTDARIRARVKPISREKPSDRRRRGRKDRSSSERTGPKRDSQSTNTPAGTTPRERSASESAPVGPTGGGAGRRRRRGGKTRQVEGTTVERDVDIPIEDQAAAAEDFVRGLAAAFEADAVVTHRTEEDDVIFVDVEGADLGLLVGPRGATLTAIEELVRTVLQRHTGGHGARIHVDVAGYRAKRREALAAFAHQLIDRVLETGREQVLEPMPAADRKVVHDVAAEVEGVATASEGEEPRRRVVIRRS